jgi:hypothetical protein
MDLNTKDIQLQYEGFLNTPLLWKSDAILGLAQLNLPTENSTSFNSAIPKNLRLGKRVERFISHELQQYSSIKILAENIQIQNGKTTIGEIDFIIQQNSIPIHLEVVYKFYLFDETVGSSEIEHWIGPNRKDSLTNKLTKLKEKQLPLIFRPEALPLFTKLNLHIASVQQKVYFKAQLFIPFHLKHDSFPLINNECIKGFYINFKELNQFKTFKFFIPTKVNWLQEIQIQINWKNYNTILPKIENLMEQKTSPLCWVKQPNGKVYKIFIVWWK